MSAGPVMFGITALDTEGNESDMTTLDEPFHLQVPSPPRRLRLEPADGHLIRDDAVEEAIEPDVIQRLIAQVEDQELPDRDIRPASQQDADEAYSARFDIGSIF